MHRNHALALCFGFAAGCVLVSSTTKTPPREDAGVDAYRPPRPDARGIDVPERPLLTREQATNGLLASIGANVALPTYRELATEAAALEAAVASYASARTSENLTAAREAWIRMMNVVERAEVLQFGPAGMAVPEIQGGRGLRDGVYVFPINRCFVDVAVERQIYADLEALAAQPAFARGMGAIEYQLFDEGTAHGCDPGATTRVDDEVWNALGADGVRQRRAEAAHADAQLVRRAADALVLAWSADGEDFAGELVRAGAGTYATTQQALNAMYWAMFYIDRGVKDMKLGVPTGISELCGDTSCPERIESRWAGRSAAHIVANLIGLQQIFLGGPASDPLAIGFDDLLRAIDQAPLALDMELAIAHAIDVASAIGDVTIATFAEHEAELEALHAAVRSVTTLLKVDFAGVLAFTPPPGAGEDND
jgi:uncharacterized protein